MKVKVYISQPYTGKTKKATIKNIQRANTTAKQVALLGHNPLVPHNLYRLWDYDKKVKHLNYLELAKEWMFDCDCILISNKKISVGVADEIETAEKLAIPIIKDIKVLKYIHKISDMNCLRKK